MKVAREAAGLSQTELAERIGLPAGQPHISRMERCDEDPATLTQRFQIARVLGTTVDALLGTPFRQN